MDDEANVHQPMTDDGVSHHGDKDQGKVRSNPSIGGVTCEEGKNEVTNYRAAATDHEPQSEVLELGTRQTSCARPLRDEHGESREPGKEKIRCEERVERPSLAGGSRGRERRIAHNESRRQREGSEHQTDREVKAQDPFSRPFGRCRVVTNESEKSCGKDAGCRE